MELSLTADLEEFVARKVISGQYPSATEVIQEALRQLRGREELEQQHEALRKAIASGIAEADQGLTDPFTDETLAAIKARARARRQNGTAPS